MVGNHLLRLAFDYIPDSLPFKEEFLDESLMGIETAPRYAHIANYLSMGKLPSYWAKRDENYFMSRIHTNHWEEPSLDKYYLDQIIRKCVPKEEQYKILQHYHEMAREGHFSTQKTTFKVLHSRFY